MTKIVASTVSTETCNVRVSMISRPSKVVA
jgi:hypothetical protein